MLNNEWTCNWYIIMANVACLLYGSVSFNKWLSFVSCLTLYGSTFKLFNYGPQSITPITIPSVPYTFWLLPSCLPIGPSLLDPLHRPKPAPVFVFTRTRGLIVSTPVYLCVSLPPSHPFFLVYIVHMFCTSFPVYCRLIRRLRPSSYIYHNCNYGN